MMAVILKVLDVGTVRLSSCTLHGARHAQGLFVDCPGSSAHATKSNFFQNSNGDKAGYGGTLTAVACTSSGNADTGFHAEGQGSVVNLTDCTSDKDGQGCCAELHAKLCATRVEVTSSVASGFTSAGGEMVLQDCSA